MAEDKNYLIYATFEGREAALSMARTLVAERLLACANVVDGITSVYEWQGKVCEDTEALFIGKTTEARLEALKARFAGLHDYDCPCLVAVPIKDGLAPFLAWVAANTQVE